MACAAEGHHDRQLILHVEHWPEPLQTLHIPGHDLIVIAGVTCLACLDAAHNGLGDAAMLPTA